MIYNVGTICIWLVHLIPLICLVTLRLTFRRKIKHTLLCDLMFARGGGIMNIKIGDRVVLHGPSPEPIGLVTDIKDENGTIICVVEWETGSTTKTRCDNLVVVLSKR